MLCQLDPYRTTVTTTVLACDPDGDAFAVRLADELLYAESGGQPSDTGSVGGQPVLGLRKGPTGVVHRLAAPVSGEVEVRLDWARRFDHMQQHSGQHLLSALAQDRFGLPTTAFHLGPDRCDIEVDGAVEPAALVALEEAVNAAIREARPLRVREVAPEALPGLPVRTRGLPEGFTGLVRLVEIDGIDLNTCGGTHVAHTAELQVLSLVGVERLKRGTRLHFLVGGRVRRQLGAALEREGALSRLLSCPPPEHLAAVERALDDAKAQAKQARALSLELAGLLGATLVPSEGLVRLHRPDGDPAFLAAIADAVRARHPEAVVVLTAGAREGVFLVAGPEAEVARWGPHVAATLEGKGGGARGKFQGKAARVDREIPRP